MRIIAISDYNYESMQLAKPVYDGKGRVLLGIGATVNPKYLSKLVELGIKQLVVEDLESQGITLEEMMDMPTWLDVVQVVQNAFERAANKKSLDIKSIHEAVGKLIAEVKLRNVIMLIPTISVSKDLQACAHAVNVALLSLQVGKKLGYNEMQLRDLGIGALLHDIGKVLSPGNDHTIAGFNILRSVREISLLSAHVCYQHHETIDGKGYPRGMKDADIIELAMICGVVNLFENLISEKNVPPHEALEIVMSQADSKYPTAIVSAFVNSVPCYPPGTTIQLNRQLKAIVTRITSHLQRPVVRIIETGKELSLADNPTLIIT